MHLQYSREWECFSQQIPASKVISNISITCEPFDSEEKFFIAGSCSLDCRVTTHVVWSYIAWSLSWLFWWVGVVLSIAAIMFVWFKQEEDPLVAPRDKLDYNVKGTVALSLVSFVVSKLLEIGN
eukprot:TRINITY_DN29062_c0_g1_i1.p1 TRINITY_DN29062_c0_g1~~TRINITY_DN29062_c0_g1_i1.p1  ORF type:complete len:124 (-),score=20.75 TRINITY_DN29062_c0_g1_i1:23-394(-)